MYIYIYRHIHIYTNDFLHYMIHRQYIILVSIQDTFVKLFSGQEKAEIKQLFAKIMWGGISNVSNLGTGKSEKKLQLPKLC